MNRILAITFFLFVLSLFGSSLCCAANYYVDFDSGSDSNNGTSTGSAFKHCPGDPNATGTANSTTLAAGDVVTFRGGVVYLGYIEITASGTTGTVLTFDGNSADTWGSGRAIIDGEGDVLFEDARKYGFFGDGGDGHLLIDNFEIRNLIYVDEDVFGAAGYAIQIEGDENSNIEIRNCYVHDVFKTPTPVDINTELTNTAVTTTTFAHTGKAFAQYAGVPTEVAIHKIVVGWDAGNDSTRISGFIGVSDDSGNMNIYTDLHLTQAGWEENIDPSGHDGEFFYWIYNMRGGTWAQALSSGSGIRVKNKNDVSIHDNIVGHAQRAITVTATNGDNVSGIDVYDNVIFESSWGLRVSNFLATVTDVRIYGNTVSDFYLYTKYAWGWHMDGLWVDSFGEDGCSDIEIYNNTITGDMRGALTSLIIAEGTASDLKIYNNVLATSAASQVFIFIKGEPSRGNTINDALIYNNTVAKVPGSAVLGIRVKDATNCEIMNNISSVFADDALLFFIEPDALTGFDSDYNLMNSVEATGRQLVYNVTEYDVDEWIALGNFDQNSVAYGDAVFSNIPAFAATMSQDGTTTRIYYDAISATYPTNTFEVGDYIEHELDGVSREVTNVEATYFDIAGGDALSTNSLDGQIVYNWKTSTDAVFDLSLLVASDAINAGTDLSAEIPALDIDGIARPQGAAWDIGAYEYVSGPTPPTPPSGNLVMIRRND